MTVWTIPLSTKVNNPNPTPVSPNFALLAQSPLSKPSCDEPQCQRIAIGTWQEDSHLCERHWKLAEAYWSKRTA